VSYVQRRYVIALLGGVPLWLLLGGCDAPRGRRGGPVFVPPAAEAPGDERAMFDRINRDRSARRLPPLAYDDRLAGVARAHALDMRIHRFFEHTSPTTGTLEDRLVAADIPFATARENLAESWEVQAAQDGLLASPGHFENLMATDITHVGVGVVRGGAVDPRNSLFVQVFARPVPAESNEEADARVRQRIASDRQARGLAVPTSDPALEAAARDLIDTLDDEVSQSSLQTISDALVRRTTGRVATPVTVLGRRVVASTEYTTEPALLMSPRLALGLAARSLRDPNGTRFLKLLVFARSG
jgi:hypothetical protein